MFPSKKTAFAALFAVSAVATGAAASQAGWQNVRSSALSCKARANSAAVYFDSTGAYNSDTAYPQMINCPVVPARLDPNIDSTEYLGIFINEGGTTTETRISTCVTYTDVLGTACESVPGTVVKAGTRFSGHREKWVTPTYWNVYLNYLAVPFISVSLAPKSMLKGWMNYAWQ